MRYSFRHRTVFPAEMFERFSAACNLFAARLRAMGEEWERLGFQGPRPSYHFVGPALSGDGRTATLEVAGTRSYAAVKMLEDSVPKELWQFFPESFRVELEYECTGQWLSLTKLMEGELRELVTMGRVAEQRLRELQRKS